MALMAMLADICALIDRESARGGKTLSLLHSNMLRESAGGDSSCQAVAEMLVRTAAKPYFAILSRWLHRGIIDDAGDDFFVVDHELMERSVIPLDYSDDYWERRYSIRAEQIPAFLRQHADMILRTGKYLNVIQQCDKSIKWPAVEDASRIAYTSNSEEYARPLEKAYEFASKTLLELLVRDRDLVGHLRSVKHYFLLDQGDFIVQFMDLCESELQQSVNRVEPARLDSLLELALRTSAANCDPYKDNVRVELLTVSLLFQMHRVLSINTDAEAEYKNVEDDNSELSGLEAFSFNYEVQWPISLVLNRRALACYQMLLRQLFYAKHVERKLCRAWIATKGGRRRHQRLLRQSFALRQKMLNFIQDIEYYMTFEVLEPNWEQMTAKIRSGKVENVDQVLEIHHDFYSVCLTDCMLSDPGLLTGVRKILSVSAEFADFLPKAASELESSSKDEDVEAFQSEVNKFDLSFSSVLFTLLDTISKLGRENYNQRILNILSRLDFNGFYTTALDQFSAKV